MPCAETSSPAQMIERKEQPPARNRESRQTTTTTESGGGGLVSVFAPPYGEDEPPAFLIGTKTPKRGHEGRIIGTKGAKRGHENAGKASTPPKPRPRVVLSSWLSIHCKAAPLRAAGAKIEQPPKGKASTPRPPYRRNRTRQKWKKRTEFQSTRNQTSRRRAVSFWPYFWPFRIVLRISE